MNFLRGQDDFFQTANQPISVRNLSQPYNKQHYYFYISRFQKYCFLLFYLSHSNACNEKFCEKLYECSEKFRVSCYLDFAN